MSRYFVDSCIITWLTTSGFDYDFDAEEAPELSTPQNLETQIIIDNFIVTGEKWITVNITAE